MIGHKVGKYPLFLTFCAFCFVFFEINTCILHHLAFLVWLPTYNFSTPITCFLPLKPHFLIAILPFLAMYLVALKDFVYTIAVYFYAFHLAFSSILHCI